MGGAKRKDTESPATVVGGGPHRDDVPEAPGAPDARAFDPPRDRFVERGELGRGGMGRVADAYDRSLDRAVAIKTIHTSSRDDLMRFAREAQITARLEHPGIVPVYDAGRDEEGRPYYVMRKVDGRALDKIVLEADHLDARLALVPHLLAAADAVAFAHARGVIHRDLKPTNILVGAFGETLVIDWGLARSSEAPGSREGDLVPITDPQLTRAGVVAGTPGFMSPEQARGETVDARADVYALGATLFFVLSGSLPFATDSATRMIELAGANREAEWSRLPPGVPADLVAIMRKAMRPSDDDRYADAGALAADLRRFVTGKVVGAHRYGVREQLARFLRRHRAAVAIAVIALAVIAVGGTLSVQRVLAERDEARRARDLSDQAAREAAARNDEYLVQHAFDLVDKNPLQTIAVLRQLRPESTQWAAAAQAAEAARARGIPFGFAFGARLRNFAFSPSGRWLLVRRLDEALTLVDLRGRTRRSLGSDASARLDWLDERWVAGIQADGIHLLDVVSGTRRLIPARGLTDMAHLHDGTAYVRTEARTVHRVDGQTSELGPPVADRVDELAPVIGQGLVMARAGRLYLLRADGMHELPGAYDAARGLALLVGVDIVMAYLNGKTCAWQLAGEPRLEVCVAGTAGYSGVTSRDGIIELRGGTLWSHSSRGAAVMRASGVRGGYQLRRHFIAVLEDGTTQIREETRWLGVVRRDENAVRAVVSDGREWLASDQASGEVTVFDLAAIRPQRYAVDGSAALVALSATDIVVTELGDGLSSIDRATGRRTLIAPVLALDVGLSSSRRWIVVVDDTMKTPLLVDTQRQRRIAIQPGHLLLMGTDPPYAIDERGTLFRYDGGSPATAATLGGTLSYAHVNGDAVALVLEPPRLCRLALASGQASCVGAPDTLTRSLSDGQGGAWGASASALYRWDGAMLLRIPLDQPPQSLHVTEHFVVAIGASTVTTVDRTSLVRRAYPAPGFRFVVSAFEGDRLLGPRANQRLGAFDLHSGREYVLNPNVEVENSLLGEGPDYMVLRSDGAGARMVEVYRTAAPLEPAALRRWLRDVTNMREVPGSEAVTWP